MKPGIVVAIIGCLVALVFAYANVGLFLTGPTGQNALALVILLALAAIVGALPGLVIQWLSTRRPRD